MRTPRWPFWVWPVGGILVVLSFNGFSWLPRFTTSGPAYCLTCHSSGETPDMGGPSQVHPGYDQVSCTQCHAQPGQFVVVEGYRGGFSAAPERVSTNCQRCHQDISTKPESEFRYNPLGIRIPHQFHLEFAGARCTDCHRNIAHDLAQPPTNRPRMEYCYQCHDSRTTSCAQCHAAGLPSPSKAPVVATGGASESYAKMCAACHGEKGSQLPGANLSSRAFLEGRGKASLGRAIAEGVGGMPAYAKEKGGGLTQGEIEALVDFLLAQAR